MKSRCACLFTNGSDVQKNHRIVENSFSAISIMVSLSILKTGSLCCHCSPLYCFSDKVSLAIVVDEREPFGGCLFYSRWWLLSLFTYRCVQPLPYHVCESLTLSIRGYLVTRHSERFPGTTIHDHLFVANSLGLGWSAYSLCQCLDCSLILGYTSRGFCFKIRPEGSANSNEKVAWNTFWRFGVLPSFNVVILLEIVSLIVIMEWAFLIYLLNLDRLRWNRPQLAEIIVIKYLTPYWALK